MMLCQTCKVLTTHCGLVLDNNVTVIDEEDLEQVQNIEFTKELPLDIQSKLSISLIHLKKAHLAARLIETIIQANVEDYGDIYLDIAEAYMDNQQYEQASTLLEALVNSQK